MTQRIFDVENEKDMADLWDILPDRVFRIHTSEEIGIKSSTFFQRLKNGLNPFTGERV